MTTGWLHPYNSQAPTALPGRLTAVPSKYKNMETLGQKPEPQLLVLPPRLVVGLHQTMNLVNDQTPGLWQRFGPLVKAIACRADNQRISMSIYPSEYSFQHFDPQAFFTKWAAVEVNQPMPSPPSNGLTNFTIPGGAYASFTYQGPASGFPEVMAYILTTWMPAKGLEPDKRPFFEILGPEYHPADPEAREEVFIPVRPVSTE